MRKRLTVLISAVVVAVSLMAIGSTAFAIGPILGGLSIETPDVSAYHLRTAEVVSLDYEADTVYLVDAVGFRWQFAGCEDWCTGDIAELLLWDCNGTPDTILDDVILKTEYSGYVRRELSHPSYVVSQG